MPTTPVSAEALTALHDLIKDLPRLHKYVQKLADAAHVSFAERAFLYDHSRPLNKVDGEAKKGKSDEL